MKPRQLRISREEVEYIVDSVVTEPSHANELKRRLRQVLEEGHRERPAPLRREDDRDLWDNVPI